MRQGEPQASLRAAEARRAEVVSTRSKAQCAATEHRAAKGGTVRRCGTTMPNCGHAQRASAAPEHRAAEGEGGARFSVSDKGIGIAREHLPRLTERFYRVDRGRSRDAGGTGLGLAIVKHVLERHQAVLQIDSEPGRGSTFSVVFPAHRVQS